MNWYPTHISGSRAAYALGLGDERYGTPLQEQRRLLQTWEPDPIDESDPTHPAVQGNALEGGILELGAKAWAKRHGHPIEVIHTAAMDGPEGDPIGGLKLFHPEAPCSCHPDAFFLCRECNLAWLVDAKRYGSELDTLYAKDELRVQLTFNLAISLETMEQLPLGMHGAQLSELALGAVLRISAWREQDENENWSSRAVLTPDILEVETTEEIRGKVIARCSEWMERYVIPWFDDEEVEDAPPVTYTDINIMWPEEKEGEVLVGSAELIDLVVEHRHLSEKVSEINESKKEYESRRKELRVDILLAGQDAEAIVEKKDGPAVCTLKSSRGWRQVNHSVKTYNKKREVAKRKREKKDLKELKKENAKL